MRIWHKYLVCISPDVREGFRVFLSPLVIEYNYNVEDFKSIVADSVHCKHLIMATLSTSQLISLQSGLSVHCT